MSTTTDLSTLVINYLTQAQYDAEVQAGTIDEDALYMTPDAGGGGSGVIDVEVDGTSVVVNGVAEIDLTGKADIGDIPTNVSDLYNDSGYITGYTETDPVFLASAAHGISSSDITAWNAKSDFSGSYTDLTNKPTIPTKVSDLYNDSGFITGYTETDPVYSASAASGITSSDISAWNGKSDFSGNYNDLTNKPTIPTITDTYSGTSSDGMSGKAVKSAIDALDGTISGSAGSSKTLTAFSQTDGKVSATFGNISITKSQVSDFPTIPTITDTYSGTSSNGMSGKAVKSAIDALDGTVTGSAGSSKTLTAFSQTDGKVSATFGSISITKSQVSDFPTAVSSFTNDAGYLTSYTETDPVFTASAAHGISSTDISNWNGKSDFSGSYADLTDKPTIPTDASDISATDSASATSDVQTLLEDTFITTTTKTVYAALGWVEPS